jgi:3-phenylpropionate/trans-cinnamate dioxygenase ferredoxin reductase subunit
VKQDNCIIIGASHAAAELIPQLRQAGWEGSIQVIGDEDFLPYHRPPLSKDFLAATKDVDDLLIRHKRVYEKHDVEFKLGHRVTSIDSDAHTVTLDNGEVLGYSKLALCTGSRARQIPLPGIELGGVHYLRTIADVMDIQRDVREGGKAVIVGGGYIGLETAAVLKKLGMKVTVLEMLPRILARVTAPELSEFYTRIHSEEGVDIQCDMAVEAIDGSSSGHVSRVVCAGGKVFDANLVIVGAGIVPNVELAEEAGLEVDNGILVDEFGQTSDPDIVAAGDCSNHPNKLLGRRLRLESVPNATGQARSAAASICGKQREYAEMPWFWSDQYDVKLQIAGLNQGYDQVVLRGDMSTGRSFVAYYLQDGKLLAADCVNRPEEFVIARRMLALSMAVNAEKLADESVNPKEFVSPA